MSLGASLLRNPKALHFLHWCDLEVYIITYSKLNWPSPLISITFLTRLCGFHVLLFDLYSFLSFFHEVDAIVPPFTGFNLV